MSADAQPDQVEGTYSIARYVRADMAKELIGLDHLTLVGIIDLLLGNVPPDLNQGGEPGQEWKIHMGGEHWIVATRTS